MTKKELEHRYIITEELVNLLIMDRLIDLNGEEKARIKEIEKELLK